MSSFEDELFYKRSLMQILSEAPGDEDEEEEAEEEETEEDAEEEGEESEEESEEGEEKEEESDEPEKKGSFEKSLDADLDAIFIDFETSARDAVVQSEGIRKKSVKMLYEEADIDEINIPEFASNVARLVKNYENLLDMESILVSRAGEFLEDRYGEEARSKLDDELKSVHDIEVDTSSGLEDESTVPLALGARSSEG